MVMSLLQFHNLAARRGDGLRPEFLSGKRFNPVGVWELPIENLGEDAPETPRPIALQEVKPRSSSTR